MQEKVVIIGAGGHAKVIADIIIKNNDTLLGFLDDNISVDTNIIGSYKVLGTLKEAISIYEKNKNIKFIIGIGDNSIRKEIAKKYNLPYYTAIHPNAIIATEVEILKGTTIMANACINSKSIIGEHCIINTGAIIEHDNILENFVHISPNVTLGGTVKIGEGTHVGIGATVKNNINIASEVIIGAGAVVVKNINRMGTYIGVPAKLL